MKKSFSLFLAVCMLLTMFLCPAAYAAPANPYDSGIGGGIDIATQGGKSIQLVGTVDPTVISVTMPAYIPFDLSYGVARENKAVSPVIDVTNHSTVPVNITVGNTSVDLTKLKGATWSDNGAPGMLQPSQVAVGFVQANEEPDYLYNAIWLNRGANDKALLTHLGSNSVGRLFIVGNIGYNVTSTGSFTVTPTLLVKKANP